MAQRYRKRPVEIEALQWDGTNADQMRLFLGATPQESWSSGFLLPHDAEMVVGIQPSDQDKAKLFVAANDAWLPIEVGEWVLKDARGAYPCKPDIFAASYDKVDS